MLGSLKRGLLRPPAGLSAASSSIATRHAAAVAGGAAAYLKLTGRRSFAAAAAAAVGAEQGKQTHKKGRPFDKVRVYWMGSVDWLGRWNFWVRAGLGLRIDVTCRASIPEGQHRSNARRDIDRSFPPQSTNTPPNPPPPARC